MNAEIMRLMSPGGLLCPQGRISVGGGHHQHSIYDRTHRVAALVGCNPSDVEHVLSDFLAGAPRHRLDLKISWRRHIPPAITCLCTEVEPVTTLCEIWMEQCGFKMSRAMRWHIMGYLLSHPTTMVERSARERLPFAARLLAILDF